MKAKKSMTIALAALLCACAVGVGGGVAAADVAPLGETSQTVYPHDFDRKLTFESPVRDCAVYGDTFAFAYNTTITIITDVDGEKKRTDFTHASEVANLDYDGDGKLYFKNTSGSIYLYGSELTAVEEHTFQNLDSPYLTVGDNVSYTLNGKGVLTYWNGRNDQPVGEGFAYMKKYDGQVYAVKDNSLYKVTNETATQIDLSYTDFSGADSIAVGTAMTALKADGYSVKTAIMSGGVYVTQIDPDKSEEFFAQIKTEKTDGERPCLVLCQSGNASLVATYSGIYVTETSNLTEYSYSAPANDWQANAAGNRIAYAVEDVGVYASPYMCESTRVATLKSGKEHSVKVIEKFALDFLDTSFYRVSFTENGEAVTGFVAADFLTNFDFAADDNLPTEKGDSEFKYDTNVTTVVLTVLIVGLVIIAILYVVLVSSNKDKKKKRKKKRPPLLHSDDDMED